MSHRARSISAPTRNDSPGKQKKSRRRRSIKKRATPAVRLHNSWSFWFDQKAQRGMEVEDYASSIKEIGSFATVQEFWCYWNNIVDPSKFPRNSNLRMFKKGVTPMWEDAANKNGGKWSMSISKNTTSRSWMSLVLAVIGEQFIHSDSICGMVLSVRSRSDTIHLWNNDSTNQDAIQETSAHIATLLSLKEQPEYRPHSGAMMWNEKKLHQRRQSTGCSNIVTDAQRKLARTPSEPALAARSMLRQSADELSHSDLMTSTDDAYSSYDDSDSSSPESPEKKVKFKYKMSQSDDGLSITRFEEEELYPSTEEEEEVESKKSSSFSSSPFRGNTRPPFQSHRKSRSDSTDKRSRLTRSKEAKRMAALDSDESDLEEDNVPILVVPKTRSNIPKWKKHHRKAASAEDTCSPQNASRRSIIANTQSERPHQLSLSNSGDSIEHAGLSSSQQRAFTCAPAPPIYPPTPTIAFSVNSRSRGVEIGDPGDMSSMSLVVSFIVVAIVAMVLSAFLAAVSQLEEEPDTIY